ncbi:MAG: glycosyltransferase [Promethearchaeota archaeon]
MKQNLWVFSFEYAGIKKVGGLGEVPANQTKWLSERYEITLFMPSHGVHLNKEKAAKLELKAMDIEYKCKINALSVDIGDKEEDVHISFYEGEINGIKIILLAGKNKFSSKILNDPVVYSLKTLSGKLILFSLGMKHYMQQLIVKSPEKIPKIIHCHDHHPIPAMIAIRQKLLNVKRDVATVLTIHLLTFPRKSLIFLRTCGIEDNPMDIFTGDEHKKITLEELYNSCKKIKELNPSLERIGVYFSDVVTSVSESYLKSYVIKDLGDRSTFGKTDFSWNGCDWNYYQMLKDVKNNFGNELKAFNSENPFERNTLRKFFLTSGLGNLPAEEPVIESRIINDFLNKILNEFPYKNDGGKIFPFKEDGPLIITTGRISKQKGIDIILDAVHLVLRKHPDTKFVMFLMPTEFSLNEIKKYLATAKKHINNVRIVFGKVYSMFHLLHLAGDIYCAPSRWEPFGIIALESMVSGTPLVASKTGGLQESIIDLKENPEKGTGFLVPVGDTEELAKALIDLISIMKIAERKRTGTLTEKIQKELISKISINLLKDLVIKNNSYGSKIRENCINRVEKTFRWKMVTKKLIKIYDAAIKNRGLSQI